MKTVDKGFKWRKNHSIILTAILLLIIVSAVVVVWFSRLATTLIEIDVQGWIRPEWSISQTTYEGFAPERFEFSKDGTGIIVHSDDEYEEMTWRFEGRRGGDRLVLATLDGTEQVYEMRRIDTNMILTTTVNVEVVYDEYGEIIEETGTEVIMRVGNYFDTRFTLIDRFSQNILEEGRMTLIWNGVLVTLRLVLYTCLFGGLLGFAICAAKMSKFKVISRAATAYIYFFRSIPVLLLLILSFFVVFAGSGFNGVTVSIIAFSVYHSAFAAEIFRSGLISIKKDQLEATTAMGFTKRQAFVYVILPQAVRVVFPIYKGEMVRQTSISSIVRIHRGS
ncbi:MAG: ABC transporter permease subunit [Oscillospiraceae bacterium]|nr:ABC transporter permease subunit [Oscillospiraceae bacterium]